MRCNQKGERNPRAVLNSVRAIRRLRRLGVTQAVIAAAFGVTGPCVCLVATRQRWRHVR